MTAQADMADQAAHPPDAADLRRSLHEPERFTAIYDRYFTAVYKYVAGRLGPQAADDLAAETFLIAFHKRGTFDPGRGAVRPWLFGIATNLVAQHRRDEVRRYRALARAGAERHTTGGHEDRVVRLVTAERMQPALARALAKLSRGERDVVLLVALSGLAHEEVAQALDIPYGTVGSRLSRARRKLRAALGQEEAR
ncbi:RNA polymerase sigma factor [Thermomonospora cellulosilytica]|uniref:RNA polymerase sigma-70 factor (ECF subfamily) n=1 Tax=Thermomonospora cellulosilytica TaxID=1411118 RepID=A0A7W3MV07_9ACTN|nr:RNA polymerase sigma factor [Thermomonospora cellulosilytica]MBA9002442.1 RNA polymerase sigma-70 factor (ECF subfamily) [Thermomonospora cellulosilytica]